MPANKEALIRYRAINRCLINNKVCSKNKLMAACREAVGHDVAWRTIAGDIRAMRKDEQLKYYAPIVNHKEQGYSYSDSNYSIDEIPLSNDEIEAIKVASSLLNQYKNVSLFSTFGGAMEKIADKVSLQLDGEQEHPHLSFEETTADGGSTFIMLISKHIKNKITLDLEYHSFSSGSKKSFNFHPYYLKEYRNRWYVAGWHGSYDALRVLALERIKSATSNFHIDYKAEPPHMDQYFVDVIGISLENQEIEEIILKVLPRDLQFIESQPIHASQEISEKKEKYALVKLHLRINYELKSLILSFGNGMEVLEPLTLRNEIKHLLTAGLQNYE